MHRIFTFLLICFACLGAFPQDLNEKVKRSVEESDHAAAIEALKQLKASDPKSFSTGGNEYLLARMAGSNGSLALAAASYRSVEKSGTALTPFALKRLAGLARATGNLVLERHYLRRLTLTEPESLAAKTAPVRLAENALETSNYNAAIVILNDGSASLLSKPKTVPAVSVRDLKAMLADAYLRSGDAIKARSIYEGLIDTDADLTRPDDATIKAVKGLDHLDGGIGNFGKEYPALPEPEHIKRAGVYQFNREFDLARRHYQAVIDNHASSGSVAEAAFQIGRGYSQQSNFVEAVRWFENILEQYPQNALAKDALLHAASAYSRTGKPRESIARYQQYIDKYPGDDNIDRAYLNIVDVYRDQGEEAEALRWCQKTRTDLKGTPAEAVAAAAEVRLFIARERWPDALNAVEQLKTMPDTRTLPGGVAPNEAAFLRAFILEQLKRYPEAIEAYLAISDGRGEYYGWLGTQRLSALAANDETRSFIDQRLGAATTGLNESDPDLRRKNAHHVLRLTTSDEITARALDVLRSERAKTPKKKYEKVAAAELFSKREPQSKRSDHTLAAFQTLISLGLYDDAVTLISGTGSTENERYTLATYFAKGDRGNLSIAFIEPVVRDVPADLPLDLIPRDQLELLYPTPFKQHLVRHGQEHAVDARLLLAIMRQESNFVPYARSNAAARGLMQFTVPTALRINAALKRDIFDQDDLYDPGVSIEMGAAYIAGLFLEFPNQIEAVVASYNGGEENMRRWLSRTRSQLPERYVSEIAYAQSKDYVHRVMTNYRVYTFLYDEQLAPR